MKARPGLAALLGAFGFSALAAETQLPPAFRTIRSRTGYDADGVYHHYNEHGYFVALPGRAPRFDSPDLAASLESLGGARWADRFRSHRSLARALKGALDADPAAIPLLMPEIRRRFAAAKAGGASPEALRRLELLEAEIEAHAGSYVCLCRGRRDRLPDSYDEFIPQEAACRVVQGPRQLHYWEPD